MLPPKSRENSVFHIQKLISQNRIHFLKFFFYIPTGETFLYIIFKNQCCIFILSLLFLRQKPKRMRAILLALVLHMTQQKDSLLMIFLQIFSLEPRLKIARLVGVQELFQNLFLKLAKKFCQIF
jgi:hypothetical protein